MAVLTYPLRANRGKLLTVANPTDVVRQIILSVLQTYRSERIMRNRYGLVNRLFEPSGALQPIIAEVREALRYALGQRWQSVRLEVSGTFTDDGVLTLTVGYLLPDGAAGEVTA